MSSHDPPTQTIKCPFCAEQISVEAIKCKHCGSLLATGCGEALPGASNRIPAAICAILLGSLGIHKFILGLTTPGLIMLLVTVLTCGFGGVVMGLIGLIEGIIKAMRSSINVTSSKRPPGFDASCLLSAFQNLPVQAYLSLSDGA